MQIFKTVTFDAAHFLPNVPPNHKCKNIHGHTYSLTIYLAGPIQEKAGWVIDFGDVKKVLKPIIETLDHEMLNNIPGLDNPTCENIAIWLWEKIKPELPLLTKIQLNETPTSGAVYEGK